MSDTIVVPIIQDNHNLNNQQYPPNPNINQVPPESNNNNSKSKQGSENLIPKQSLEHQSKSNGQKEIISKELEKSNYEIQPKVISTADSRSNKLLTNHDEMNDDENDNASVLVIILQCETKSCDENITNLKWVFSDPYFTVQICAVDPPPNVPTTKTLSQSQYMDNYCMRKALNYAAEGPYIPNSQGTLEPQFWWTKIPVIIVKDSSVSNITPSGTTDVDHPDPNDNIIGGMKKRIKVALDKARQADLFFLCKWHDACNKYVDVEGVGSIDHGSTLKWSVQPTATQAIMYTPSARDFVREALVTATVPLSDLLNSNIAQGNLLATVFVPNIIDFDIDLATSNDDYNKLNECAPVEGTTGTSSGVASFIWFIMVVVLVLLIAWALIQLGPQYELTPYSSD